MIHFKYNLNYIKDVSNFLETIKLTNLDYKELFKLLDPNKYFIYLDPPYLSTGLKDYFANWNLDSLNELKDYLNVWNNKGGKFALSENSPLIYDLFKNYNINKTTIIYQTRIKRSETNELLVTNF